MAKVTVLTNLGEAWAAGRMAGTEDTTGRFIGWGTGTSTASKEDSALFTESAEVRATGTVSVKGSGAAAKWQCEGTLVSESTQTISEAGAFTALSSGTLILHTTFDGLGLNEGDQITFTF